MVVGLFAACGDPRPDKEARRGQSSEVAEDASVTDSGTVAPSDEPDASVAPDEAPPDPKTPDSEPSDTERRDAPAVHEPTKQPEVPAADATPRCTGSEVVTSQSYLDSFFKGCKTIGDSVYIDANTVDNLDALSEVESIAGDLVIGPGVTTTLDQKLAFDASRVRLKSLAGLSKLRQVRELVVRQLPLTELTGLAQLRWGSIELAALKSLKSLTGLGEALDGARLELVDLPLLENLTGLRGGVGTLIIENAAALRDLSGGSVTRIVSLTITDAPNLRTLASGPAVDDVALTNAPLLRDLAALRGRTHIGTFKLKGLHSLRSLTDVTGVAWMGMLWIEDCDGLEDLQGLELVAWYETFNIHDCANLRSLNGLDALTSVDYGLELRNLPALQTLHGLEKFTRASALILRDLPSLIDLSGLDSLKGLSHLYLDGAGPKSLQGLVPLEYLNALTAEQTSLESLDGLVVGQLYVLKLIENPKLARIDALRSLTGGLSLVLTGNPAIVDLDGLQNITRIKPLTLLNNVGLRELRALSNVDSISEAQILGNVRLPQCEIEWLADRAGFEVQNVESNGPVGVCTP